MNEPEPGVVGAVLRFVRLESSSSLVLLAAAALALALANSPAHAWYEGILRFPLAVRVGGVVGRCTLEAAVNDGLMALFFLVVGLEVKRELVEGELRHPRKALLPVFGAVGGVVTPAAIYLLVRACTGAVARGWGVPIATDIAFSLAVVTAFGSRLAPGLKLFLVTLAIADDVAGVVVIAVAYSGHLRWPMLGVAAAVWAACFGLGRLGVQRLWPYAVAGLALWAAMAASGVHPTLSGVMLALAVPARKVLAPEVFAAKGTQRVRALANPALHQPERRSELREHLAGLQRGADLLLSPLDRAEAALHRWVSFGVVPLFALTHAGLRVSGLGPEVWRGGVFWGVLLGLLLGKPLGITAAAWAAVKLRLAELPAQVTWAQLHAVSWVGGIGFTVSLFIAGLAFRAGGVNEAGARLAVLVASLCAAAAGALLLAAATRRA